MHCSAGSVLLVKLAEPAAVPASCDRPPHLLQHLTLHTSTGMLCYRDCKRRWELGQMWWWNFSLSRAIGNNGWKSAQPYSSWGSCLHNVQHYAQMGTAAKVQQVSSNAISNCVTYNISPPSCSTVDMLENMNDVEWNQEQQMSHQLIQPSFHTLSL